MNIKNYKTYIVFKELIIEMDPCNFASIKYNETEPLAKIQAKIQTKYKMRKVVKETSNSFLIKNNKKLQYIEKNNVYQIIRLPN